MRKGYAIISKESKTFPDYGEGKCLYCGKILKPPKRKYCCWLHGAKYRAETAPTEMIGWHDFSKRILKRDSYKCQDCGEKAINVHHKMPIYKGGEEFDEDNCISLCHNCHVIRHKGRNTSLENGKMKQFKLSEIQEVD